jgi:hypothetical protein
MPAYMSVDACPDCRRLKPLDFDHCPQCTPPAESAENKRSGWHRALTWAGEPGGLTLLAIMERLSFIEKTEFANLSDTQRQRRFDAIGVIEKHPDAKSLQAYVQRQYGERRLTSARVDRLLDRLATAAGMTDANASAASVRWAIETLESTSEQAEGQTFPVPSLYQPDREIDEQPEARTDADLKPTQVSAESRALAIALQYAQEGKPLVTKQIAKEAGCSERHLYNCKNFKAFLAAHRKTPGGLPRGKKDRITRDVEAWEEAE